MLRSALVNGNEAVNFVHDSLTVFRKVKQWIRMVGGKADPYPSFLCGGWGRPTRPSGI